MTVEVTWKSRGPWFKSGKPDFFFIVYLYLRLKKLKTKYEMNFNEKLTFYDNIKVNDNIIDNLNEIGQNSLLKD